VNQPTDERRPPPAGQAERPSRPLPADAVSVELLVPFHDVDTLRVVWHGHYVKYIEIARMEYLRRKRLSVPELEALGVMLMVAQTHLKHVAPLRHDDRFRVSAWLIEHHVRLEFEYEVFNLTTGKRAATGRSVLAAVSASAHQLYLQTPPELVTRLEAP